MESLTTNQTAVLRAIIDHIERCQCPPTIQSLSDSAVGSRRNTERYLKILEGKKYIVRTAGRMRVLALSDGAPVARVVLLPAGSVVLPPNYRETMERIVTLVTGG